MLYVGLFAPSHMKYQLDRQKDDSEPTLADMTEKAIEILSRGNNGYFLLVEGKLFTRWKNNNPVLMCIIFRITARIIAKYKLDYHNSLCYILPIILKHIASDRFKTLLRCCYTAPKLSRVSPLLKPLHTLKVKERSECKLLSLVYKFSRASDVEYMYNDMMYV